MRRISAGVQRPAAPSALPFIEDSKLPFIPSGNDRPHPPSMTASPTALRAELTPSDLAYSALVAELREPFVILDRDERLLMWNHAYAELHRDANGKGILHQGLSVDELSAWRLASGFFHVSDAHDITTEPSARSPGRGKGSSTYRLRDGRWMLVERYALFDGHNVGLWIDITALKLAENMLRETAERLSAREAELSQTQAELEEINANLEERIRSRSDELLAAQSELVKKERMVAIGQLTATVAHELRNPMAAIRNTVYMMNEQRKNGQPVALERPIERIGRSVDRCEKIIQELLDFSRSRALQCEVLAFDPWLRGVMTEFATPPGITIALDTDSGETNIALDTDRLQRVIINLVDNAVQALAEHRTEGERRVGVRTRKVGDAVELQVEDNGPGIAAEHLAKVFEPLFTTKRMGTGLGLPTVKQIVEQHGGTIVLESAVGEFTRAVIRLPFAPTSL
jgi:signal transduction histidine kinase